MSVGVVRRDMARRGVAWHARARARPTPCDFVAPLPREDRLFGWVRVYDPAGPQNLRCPLRNDPNTYRFIRNTIWKCGILCHAYCLRDLGYPSILSSSSSASFAFISLLRLYFFLLSDLCSLPRTTKSRSSV